MVSVSTKRWLLPHERWLGGFAGRVTDPPPGGTRWTFQQNYGPDGDVFLAATAADVFAAVILLFIGVILLGTSGTEGPLSAAGYWLMGIGILSGLVGILRAVQGSHAGRIFGAGRPFIRRGRPLR